MVTRPSSKRVCCRKAKELIMTKQITGVTKKKELFSLILLLRDAVVHAIVKVHVSKDAILFIMINFTSPLRLELTNVLQDHATSLGLFLPFHMVVSWSGILDSFQNLLIVLCYTLQLSFTSLFTQGV